MRRSAAVVVLIVAAVLVAAVTVLPAMAAQQVTQSPTFGRHAYSVHSGRYVTVLVRTHQQVNSPTESCRLTVSGPGARARSFVHADITGDFELTFAARSVRRGAWHLTSSCQTPRGAHSRTARATVRVVGGHGRGMLGGQTGPFFNALQAPLSAGNGGAGTPPNPFQPGQCTYYAYTRRADIYLQSVNGGAPAGGRKGDGSYWWDAKNWAYNAAHYGHFAEGPTPEAGALMVEPGNGENPAGHVAYVSSVTDSGHFVTLEMNTKGLTQANGYEDQTVYTVYDDTSPNPHPNTNPSGDSFSGGQIHRDIAAGTVFIYGGPVVNPPQYAGEFGHIVQWSGDTKAQKTAWLVVNEGGRLRRHWIPTIAIYWCLKNAGDAGPDVLPAAELDAMPDDNGVGATCTGNTVPPGSNPGAGSGGSASGPSTYAETEGHNGVNTFTDATTASGLGQRIAPAQQVQVSCKLYAPQIASVNPDGYWYLIASAPWSGAYYAPANTFMNGDPWNGPYTHNTDFNVPDCGASSAPPTTTTSTTPPPAQTWAETVGGVTHTWTDYANAGGAPGQSIQTSQTVQVACAVQGFQVADGDTWWYRIASSPWAGAYYASADAFYNNGQTTGPLAGTPFVDPAVAHC